MMESRKDLIARLRRQVDARLPTTIFDTDDARYHSEPVVFAHYAATAIAHFFPEIEVSEYDQIVRRIYLAQDIASADGDMASPKDEMIVHDEGNVLASLKDKQYIFAAFHYGSYRYINYLLGQADAKFVLLVTRDVAIAQAAKFLRISRELTPNARMEVIDVEAPGAMLTMMRLLKKGYSLLMYVDGNSGAEGMSPSRQKRQEIAFQGKKLFVRRGLFEIARLTKLPIIPVSSRYHGDRYVPSITLLEPRLASSSERSEEFMEGIFNILEQDLAYDLASWEGWLYLYRFIADFHTNERFDINPVGASDDDEVSFDHRNYAILSLPSRGTWLLNKRKLSVRNLTPAMAKPLMQLAAKRTVMRLALRGQPLRELAELGCLKTAGA